MPGHKSWLATSTVWPRTVLERFIEPVENIGKIDARTRGKLDTPTANDVGEHGEQRFVVPLTVADR